MTELDALRIAVEAIGLAGLVMGGVAWLGKRVLKVLAEVEAVRRDVRAESQSLHNDVSGVNKRLDELNGTVILHAEKLAGNDREIAYLKGKEDARALIAEAAAAAAKLVKDTESAARVMKEGNQP